MINETLAETTHYMTILFIGLALLLVVALFILGIKYRFAWIIGVIALVFITPMLFSVINSDQSINLSSMLDVYGDAFIFFLIALAVSTLIALTVMALRRTIHKDS